MAMGTHTTGVKMGRGGAKIFPPTLKWSGGGATYTRPIPRMNLNIYIYIYIYTYIKYNPKFFNLASSLTKAKAGL